MNEWNGAHVSPDVTSRLSTRLRCHCHKMSHQVTASQLFIYLLVTPWSHIVMNSLRDSYIPPSSAWAFLPQNPISTVVATPLQSSQPVYQWSTRSKHNSIFDLSPSLDLTEPSGIDASLFFRSIIASVVLGYTSTVIAMPWEVGKMLLQVQWVPRHAREPDPVSDPVQDEVEVVSFVLSFISSIFDMN